MLVNLGQEPYEGEPGDRIAQLLLVPCLTPDVREVDELPPARRPRRPGSAPAARGGIRTLVTPVDVNDVPAIYIYAALLPSPLTA